MLRMLVAALMACVLLRAESPQGTLDFDPAIPMRPEAGTKGDSFSFADYVMNIVPLRAGGDRIQGVLMHAHGKVPVAGARLVLLSFCELLPGRHPLRKDAACKGTRASDGSGFSPSLVRESTTGDGGAFVFAGLPVGLYGLFLPEKSPRIGRRLPTGDMIVDKGGSGVVFVVKEGETEIITVWTSPDAR